VTQIVFIALQSKLQLSQGCNLLGEKKNERKYANEIQNERKYANELKNMQISLTCNLNDQILQTIHDAICTVYQQLVKKDALSL